MTVLKNLYKNNKKTLILLFLIILVGIFLRTYKFHDWLRFSRDQVRDIKLIDSALEGKDHLPLLGPNAGVTRFRLGPIYYYFSYASEKIFGAYPDKMAYPSVFFSILAIPLLFFFLREFFNDKISLFLTAIMSVSYLMVINSRFSSNPNLIPFFILLYLYALLKILNKDKHAYVWSILLGISLGVNIQLHTTLLIALPIMSLIIFLYLLKNNFLNLWKLSFVILATALIVNTSQIISELDSNWQNTKYFFKGFQGSTSNHYFKYAYFISACQIQANAHTISAFENDDACNEIFSVPQDSNVQKYIFYPGIALSIIFSLAGYYLLIKNYRREKDIKRKHFLGIILLFNLISFIILIPIAKIIFVGYFINLFMVPLVLLGLIIIEIQKKLGFKGQIIVTAGMVGLIFCCLFRDVKTANSYMNGLENNAKNSTLSEVELISQYLLENKQTKYYLGGQNGLPERFFRPVDYFTSKHGIETRLIKPNDTNKIDSETPIYYLKENEPGEIPIGKIIWGRKVIAGQKFSGLTVLVLRNL